MPDEDMADPDPGLARQRTELSWTRTAISFAALGGFLLKSRPYAASRSWPSACWRRAKSRATRIPGLTTASCRIDRSAGRASVQLRPADLAPRQRDFMTGHHDLRVLGRMAAAQQAVTDNTVACAARE